MSTLQTLFAISVPILAIATGIVLQHRNMMQLYHRLHAMDKRLAKRIALDGDKIGQVADHDSLFMERK